MTPTPLNSSRTGQNVSLSPSLALVIVTQQRESDTALWLSKFPIKLNEHEFGRLGTSSLHNLVSRSHTTGRMNTDHY